MDDKKSLLKKIMICDFALKDANLFLDTHPTDKDALNYYKTTLAMREKVADEYVLKYGPLTTLDFTNDNEWEWATTPWPWETIEGV